MKRHLSKKAATIQGLLACGAYEQKNRSSIYRTFVFGNQDVPVTYLVGSRGALRRTKTTIAEAAVISGGRIHAAYAYVGQVTNGPNKELNAGQCRHLVAQIVRYGEKYIVACSESLAAISAKLAEPAELLASGAIAN